MVDVTLSTFTAAVVVVVASATFAVVVVDFGAVVVVVDFGAVVVVVVVGAAVVVVDVVVVVVVGAVTVIVTWLVRPWPSQKREMVYVPGVSNTNVPVAPLMKPAPFVSWWVSPLVADEMTSP